jgi:hypothetical protein
VRFAITIFSSNKKSSKLHFSKIKRHYEASICHLLVSHKTKNHYLSITFKDGGELEKDENADDKIVRFLMALRAAIMCKHLSNE